MRWNTALAAERYAQEIAVGLAPKSLACFRRSVKEFTAEDGFI
jgi:hypothetical protein